MITTILLAAAMMQTAAPKSVPDADYVGSGLLVDVHPMQYFTLANLRGMKVATCQIDDKNVLSKCVIAPGFTLDDVFQALLDLYLRKP